MTSDEQRRAVAARLRGLRGFEVEGKKFCSCYDVEDALGLEGSIMCSRTAVETLADLIDRPTCKPKDRGRGYVDAVCDSFWCPNCSFEIDVHIGEEQHLTEAAKYCPNCGAEVVE